MTHISIIWTVNMDTSFLLLLFMFLYLIKSGFAIQIVGYDCAGKTYKNLVRYSANKVADCPSFQGWFQYEEPVEIQVLRIPKKRKIQAYICDVRVSHRVNYCGYDSILHGTEIQLDQEAPHELTKGECTALVFQHRMSYSNETWTDERKEFTKEVVTKGKRNSTTGTCSPSSTPFSFSEKTFNSHIQRDVVTVRVHSHEFEYLEQDQTITIRGNLIDVKSEYHKSGKQAYVWKAPSSDCQKNPIPTMKETYSGYATLLKPTNRNVPDMVLVNDRSSQTTFGLELSKETTSYCGHEMYDTNLLDIKVTMNKTWFNEGRGWKIDNVVETNWTEVDRIQDLKGLAVYNLGSTSQTMTSALAQLSHDACETKRKVTLSNLAILRMRPEEGSFRLFGRGYNALLRGNTFLAYKCERKVFQYRPTPNDYQDIPVMWMENSTQHHGFLDSVSFKLKSSSYDFQNYGQLPVMYQMEKEWRCKQNSLIQCARPEVLSHDFNIDRKKLDLAAGVFEHDGGFDDIETRKNFRATINEKSDIEASYKRMIRDITDHVDEEEIYNKFNLADDEQTILKTVLLGNSWKIIIKGLSAVMGFVTVILIGQRLHMWCTQKGAFKRNMWNCFHALFNPTQFFTNLHSENHEKLLDELDEVLVIVNDRKSNKTDEEAPEFDATLPPSHQIQRLSGAYFRYPGEPSPETETNIDS